MFDIDQCGTGLYLHLCSLAIVERRDQPSPSFCHSYATVDGLELVSILTSDWV